jgi:DNA-binding CsgD family transcriptional regulator
MDRNLSRADAAHEVLKRRAVPTFYVVDKALRVVLACSSPNISQSDALPPTIERIARNVMRQVKHVSDSVLAMDGDTVVRIIKPYATDADLTCVIIEKLRTRDPIGEAVQRHGMTHRQADVLRLLMQGAPNIDIASQLHIATATVEDHVRNIAAKTDALNRSQVISRVLGFL